MPPVISDVSPHQQTMLIVASLLVALFAFWAYIRWDARRLRDAPVTPIARPQMERGFKPAGIVKWQVYLGLGCIAGLLAFLEWQAPSQPPFSGRWSAVKSLVFEVLGRNGLVGVYIAIAVALLLAALSSFRGSRECGAEPCE